MSLAPDSLVGAWSLVDWRIEYRDGRVTRPYGDDASGQLLYSADGRMSATVAAASRARLEQANARKASDVQKAAAFDSFFHYAGTWRIEDDTVVHSVVFALNPDMVGTEQRRKASLNEANDLELSAGESLDEGSARRHVLTWRRVAA